MCGYSRSVAAIAVVVGLGLASPGRAKGPETWAELQASLPEAEGARVKALARFTKASQASLGDRLTAARELEKAQVASPRQAAQALLTQAYLYGLGGDEKERRRALVRAKSTDAGVARFVDDALEADKALRWVRVHTEKRRWGAPLGPNAKTKLSELERAARKAYSRRDPIRLGAARLAVARLQASGGDDDEALKSLARLNRVGGKSRDGAPVRAQVRRLRARILEAQGDIKGALRETLLADKLSRAPLDKPASFAKERGVYTRSRATMERCYRAKQEHGIDCGTLVSIKERGYYDFSQEETPEFDEERAQHVAVEYGDLIPQCMKSFVGELRGTTLQLEWSVDYDGQVRSSRVYRPRRLRGSKFEKCVKASFKLYRYPKYKGEVHNLAMEFYVNERN